MSTDHDSNTDNASVNQCFNAVYWASGSKLVFFKVNFLRYVFMMRLCPVVGKHC